MCSTLITQCYNAIRPQTEAKTETKPKPYTPKPLNPKPITLVASAWAARLIRLEVVLRKIEKERGCQLPAAFRKLFRFGAWGFP